MLQLHPLQALMTDLQRDQLVDPILAPARVAAIRELALDATTPQASLSGLTRIACQLLGMPIAIASIVGPEHQTLVGSHGLNPDVQEAGDNSLNNWLCQHVVREGRPIRITDARLNPLACDAPVVQAGTIVAYAGAPLCLPGGELAGAFAACDHAPRVWTDDDLTQLQEFAAIAVELLELHRVTRGAERRDALTGLPRRAPFAGYVGQLLAATPSDPVTIVAADLAGFRLVNDAWGHDAGDAVLVETARRFSSTVGPDAVCRLAGDEFLIASSSADPDHAAHLLRHLRHVLAFPPFQIQGVDQPLGATFATRVVGPGAAPDAVIDQALSALATAKSSDARELPSDTTGLADAARRRLQIRNAIGGAELRGELKLVYQPMFALATNELQGFEALLRWTHPELGFVRPDEFIPVAEQSGAILPIGDWVLETACRDLVAWRAQYPQLELSMAVNVAPEQIRVSGFSHAIGRLLRRSGLPASALTLEITERTLLGDGPVERHELQELREMGVSLALDDFGTGFSSLGYLTRFPLNVLKIDRMFVQQVGTDERGTALVGGILALAKSIGLETVAEGIEDQTQRGRLIAMGCEHGQGYLLAKPMARAKITALLVERSLSELAGG